MKTSLVCALIATVCVIVQTACAAATMEGTGGDVNQLLVYGNDVNGRRWKRGSFSLIGEYAVKKLISGAKRIPTKERNVRVFQKAGDFKTAMEEFKSLRPTDLKEISYPFGYKVLYGNVGDRFIQLANNGIGGKATLSILKQEKDLVSTTADRIIYTN